MTRPNPVSQAVRLRERARWCRALLATLVSGALVLACSTSAPTPSDPSSLTSGDLASDDMPTASAQRSFGDAPSYPGDGPPSAAPGASAGVPSPPLPPSVEPEELTGYRWPIRGGRITSFFDYRETGFFVIDGERVHAGLDVSTFCGDRIRAAHGGTVVAAGRLAAHEMAFDAPLDAFFDRIDTRGTLGYQSITVVIDDGNGYRSAYVHLSEVAVEPGDVVAAGDHIGYEGATGNASGCHLHYELIRMDGPWMAVAGEFVRDELYPANARQRIDPMRVLSLDMPGAGRLVPGIDPPEASPGLGRPTVVLPEPS